MCMKIKEEFHQLIDSIDDEDVLKSYFQLVQLLTNEQTGKLWNQLTDLQKEDLLLAYEESFTPENLVSHNHVKQSHSKWLGK